MNEKVVFKLTNAFKFSSGASDWLIQRISAVVLGSYFLTLVGFFLYSEEIKEYKEYLEYMCKNSGQARAIANMFKGKTGGGEVSASGSEVRIDSAKDVEAIHKKVMDNWQQSEKYKWNIIDIKSKIKDNFD